MMADANLDRIRGRIQTKMNRMVGSLFRIPPTVQDEHLSLTYMD